LVSASTSTTSYTLPIKLEVDKTYTWRARAEYAGEPGPWSAAGSFMTPKDPEGYIRGNEVFDPLINGKSIGQIVGPATFIPGVGLRFDDRTTYVVYNLGATLEEGEFSVLTTNIKSLKGEVNKSKLFSMCQGDNCEGDLAVNVRRFTVEKRGTGEIAWRVITSGDQIDTVGDERVYVPLFEDETYFWRATWGGEFNLVIRENGPTGPVIYDFGKSYDGYYDPDPHFAFLGAPPHRSGPDNQSVPDVIYRGVWISGRPRPEFANK